MLIEALVISPNMSLVSLVSRGFFMKKALTMGEIVVCYIYKAYFFLELSGMKFNPSKSQSETLCFDTLIKICKAGVRCGDAWDPSAWNRRNHEAIGRHEPG